MDVDVSTSGSGGRLRSSALGDMWRKSSASGDGGGGNCVEARFDGRQVLVRDSKYLRWPQNDPAAQPMVSVRADQWPVFLEAAAGLPHDEGATVAALERIESGQVVVRSGDGTDLIYSEAEWDAFVLGIRAGEFDVGTAPGEGGRSCGRDGSNRPSPVRSTPALR